MDFFSTTELGVPVSQIALLLTLSTLTLLFGKIRTALLITYLFTFYWGFVFNREFLLGSAVDQVSHFAIIYFGFGLLIVIFTLIGFIAYRN
jgi:hypothetical protein